MNESAGQQPPQEQPPNLVTHPAPDVVAALVTATAGGSSTALMLQHGVLSATEAAHRDADRQIAAGRAAADAVDDDLAACAATFGKLPAYTEKVRLMTTNLRILRENVAKLRGMSLEIGSDARESIRGTAAASELEDALQHAKR